MSWRSFPNIYSNVQEDKLYVAHEEMYGRSACRESGISFKSSSLYKVNR